MPSRRATRNRKAQRKYRGGFFGKLFEGFQLSGTGPMMTSDSDMGGAAGSVGGITSTIGSTAGPLLTGDSATSVNQQTGVVGTALPGMRTMQMLNEGVSAPTAAIAPPPPVVQVQETPIIKPAEATIVTPVTTAPPPPVTTATPLRTAPLRTATPRMTAMRRGGARKTRKSRKVNRKASRKINRKASRKSRKGSRKSRKAGRR